ncbi:MAG: hypothetical protein K0R50_1892, partial [Eubacterium sp.]|nr:hypothetical protein [Eubacterium sp.]
MLAVERRKKITEIIGENKSVLVTELSRQFEVTEETIRRDLEKLEQMGILVRTYGGATLVEGNVAEVPVEQRQVINSAGKDAIAYEAAKMIKEGETIFLDASTSAYFLAKYIKNMKNITVITNSHKVITELADSESVKIISIGGMLRKTNMSFVGRVAESTILNSYFASKAFISCQGITLNRGFTDQNEQETEVKKAMIKCSDSVFVLCDQSKLGKLSYCRVADFQEVDCFITDAKLGNEWEQVFQQKDIDVVIARKEI